MERIKCYDSYGNSVDSFTQWDLDWILTINLEDYNLSFAPEVHFCNKNSKMALIMQSTVNADGKSITVKVPNILLQESYPVFIYVYLNDNKDSSTKTIVFDEVPVKKRTKPDDYVYTEEDMDILTAKIHAIAKVYVDDRFKEGIELDDTLSIEGKAADAKATGDALAGKVDKNGNDRLINSSDEQKLNAIAVDAKGNVTINGTISASNVSGLNEAFKNLDNKYAEKSHGNHVPQIETANNAKFLRNDNTWQTITPENIGAAEKSHGTHVTYNDNEKPLMNGDTNSGTKTTVSRSDHVHPVDTSRASADDLASLTKTVEGKADDNHDHRGGYIYPYAIRMTSNSSSTHGGYINFDFKGQQQGQKPDYTSRIAEYIAGTISVEGNLDLRNYIILKSGYAYGDKLPGEDGEPYTHVVGRLFLKKKTS